MGGYAVTIVDLLQVTSLSVVVVWELVAPLMWFRDWHFPLGRWLFFELRPFYLPALGVYMGIQLASKVPSWINWLTFAIDLAIWFFYKDFKDDDDRWRKRRNKASQAIARVGARLVVVPVRVNA
jgi:hypothetical protein